MRKIISISHEVISMEDESGKIHSYLTAVCDDGTVWWFWDKEKEHEWICICDIPIPQGEL